MRKRPGCLGKLVLLIFILFTKQNMITPNFSIVRANTFISGLNNEKVKVKKLLFMLHLAFLHGLLGWTAAHAVL